MARLSVNLNKVALLRNSRRTGVPDLARFARIALASGAEGLTVHPRPDERHIRGSDIPLLTAVMAGKRPAMEFNIEGYPDDRLLEILREARPEQCTLVPDAPDAFTSEEGWKLDPEQMAIAQASICTSRLRCSTCRSLTRNSLDRAANCTSVHVRNAAAWCATASTAGCSNDQSWSRSSATLRLRRNSAASENTVLNSGGYVSTNGVYIAVPAWQAPRFDRIVIDARIMCRIAIVPIVPIGDDRSLDNLLP